MIQYSQRLYGNALSFFMLLITQLSLAQTTERKRLIYADDFQKGLDTTVWVSEIQSLPGSRADVVRGKLVLDTQGGVTVWFNELLKGSIEITYTRKVVIENGKNDRLSDLNQFWMAMDPDNSNLFTRAGKFEEYDDLQLYYVGMGGNSNATTRFRKYFNGDRKLLHEYTDANHLLKAGQEYQIRIRVKDKTIQFFVDNICYFQFEDPNVLKEGYFGFRSTGSHQEIDQFRVYSLD